MQNVFVQFSDSTKTTVQAVFCFPQDPEMWPNQGAIPSNDSRYEGFYDALSADMQNKLIKPGD